MQDVQAAVNQRIFRILFVATIFVVLGGAAFYHHFEKLSWVNAYYFCIVTLTTVGYGDIVPHTNAGKIFTTFYIITGIVILGAFLNAVTRRRADKMSAKQGTKIEKKNS